MALRCKKNKLNVKVNLVEFCSLLSNTKSFQYDEKNPDKFYVAIGCKCLDSDGLYNLEKVMKNKCHHNAIPQSEEVINYIQTVIKLDETSNEKKN